MNKIQIECIVEMNIKAHLTKHQCFTEVLFKIYVKIDLAFHCNVYETFTGYKKVNIELRDTRTDLYS